MSRSNRCYPRRRGTSPWLRAYVSVVVTDTARLDVDHLISLAQGYNSERTPWSPAPREAYANDQDSPTL
ncbi:hypothetical protein [Streptomyces chryseus]